MAKSREHGARGMSCSPWQQIPIFIGMTKLAEGSGPRAWSREFGAWGRDPGVREQFSPSVIQSFNPSVFPSINPSLRLVQQSDVFCLPFCPIRLKTVNENCDWEL